MTTTAKTAAQRQADRKAREEAAGRKHYKRWVHPDDFAAMDAERLRLANIRATGAIDKP